MTAAALATSSDLLATLLPEWQLLLQGWSTSGQLTAAAREALVLKADPPALTALVSLSEPCMGVRDHQFDASEASLLEVGNELRPEGLTLTVAYFGAQQPNFHHSAGLRPTAPGTTKWPAGSLQLEAISHRQALEQSGQTRSRCQGHHANIVHRVLASRGGCDNLILG